MKITTKQMPEINIRHVKLTKESKRRLNRIKYMKGGIGSYIENGNWWIPADTHTFSKLRIEFIAGLKHFFNINEDIEIKSFDTDILGFDDGIYPDYD